jgi:hypothetical protein
MQVEGTRLDRVRDVAEHFVGSVATIDRVVESCRLAAVKCGTGTGTLGVSGAAVLACEQACEQACAQAACDLLGIDHGPTVVVVP